MGLIYKHDSERLKMAPLTLEQLVLYAKPRPAFEQKFGLKPRKHDLPTEALEVIENNLYGQIEQAPALWMYYTFWVLIDQDFEELIGDISFKGPPDQQGRLELGYGVYKNHRNSGYATEAVQAFCQYGLTQLKANTIVAHCMQANYPSIRVLEKSDFRQVRQIANLLRFEYW